MNEIRKYVASRTLTQDDLDWNNSTLLPADDVVGAVRQLRAEDGGNLQVMGSSNLVGTLINNDLVDEYRLMIEPITLGGGKRISPTTADLGPSSWCRHRRAALGCSSARTVRSGAPRPSSARGEARSPRGASERRSANGAVRCSGGGSASVFRTRCERRRWPRRQREQTPTKRSFQ
jgi:hypothetical protein